MQPRPAMKVSRGEGIDIARLTRSYGPFRSSLNSLVRLSPVRFTSTPVSYVWWTTVARRANRHHESSRRGVITNRSIHPHILCRVTASCRRISKQLTMVPNFVDPRSHHSSRGVCNGFGHAGLVLFLQIEAGPVPLRVP